jgi:hypothetical protein
MTYPTKAPTVTASMTQPLYVMNSNLYCILRCRSFQVKVRGPSDLGGNLHDHESIQSLHGIQYSFDDVRPLADLDLLMS